MLAGRGTGIGVCAPMLAGFVFRPGKLELALVLLAVCSVQFVELWFTIDCANPTEVRSRTKSNLLVIPQLLIIHDVCSRGLPRPFALWQITLPFRAPSI